MWRIRGLAKLRAGLRGHAQAPCSGGGGGLTRVQAPGNRAGGEPLLALSWLLAALEFGPGVGILDQSTIEIVVLAFIAGFVLFRLYATLGRRTERPVNPRPQPAHGAFGQAFAPAPP